MSEWDDAAIRGELDKYQGDPPPRIPQPMVAAWANRLGNAQEIRAASGLAPVAAMLCGFTMLLLLMLAALGGC